MLQREADIVMRNWGEWIKDDPLASLCYPSIEPYRKLYRLPGEGRGFKPDEKSALVVDQLMQRMISQFGHVAVVFALHYITGMTNCKLAEFVKEKNSEIEVDRKKVSAWVGIGLAWFHGAYTGIELMDAA